MRFFIWILLCSAFLCCKSEKKEKTYSISDLYFPEDNIRKARMQHHISQSYFYMESADNNGIHYRNLKSQCDSQVTLQYDKNGNITRDINGHYEYNNWNMMIHANAGRCLSSSWNNFYLFNSKDRMLCILNYSDPPYGKARYTQKDTTFVYFDEEGKVILVKSGKDSTIHQYNASGDIKLTKSFGYIKQYCYTNRKLDSTYTIHKDGNTKITDKHYYDENMLLYKAVEYLKHCPYCPIDDAPIITYSVKNIVDSLDYSP